MAPPDGYDFIIVGSGASGGVLAARLSEDPECSVLLLEAGSNRGDFAAMHQLNPMALWADEDLTWPEMKVSRTDAQSPRSYPVGRTLGGGSAVNGMGWIWAQPGDFDSFEQKYGCRGWGWSTVESVHHQIERSPDGIAVMRLPVGEWGPVAAGMRRAALNRGFSESADLNSVGATGVSPFPINYDQATERRSGVAECYLNSEVRRRPNLTIQTGSLVERLWLEQCRVAGVYVAPDGDETNANRITATREVILCCGALFTPAVLQRSGIGPADVLKEAGVPIVLEAEVGVGLQDHPVINGRIKLKSTGRSSLDTRHACALARFSSSAKRHNDLYFVSVEQSNDPRVESSDSADGFIDVMLLECTSRGKVFITAADVHTSPTARTAMLATTDDLTRMRFGVRELAHLLSRDEITEICDESGKDAVMLGRETLLTPTQVLSLTDSELDTWMQKNASDGIHVCSTCRMGRDGVCDSHGRLLGIEGLRVADASLLPTVPRANTHVTSIVVGEMIATRIREERTPNVLRILPLRTLLETHDDAACATVAKWLFAEWPEENCAAGIHTSDALAAQLRSDATTPGLALPLTLVAIDGVPGSAPRRILGTVRIDAHDLPELDEECAPWLAALYVPAEFRRAGIAASLCNAAAEYAMTLRHNNIPIDSLHLWFPTSKEAVLRPLYGKLGFKDVKRTHFEGSSFGDSVVVMKREIASMPVGLPPT